jgi:hypothetical protein
MRPAPRKSQLLSVRRALRADFPQRKSHQLSSKFGTNKSKCLVLALLGVETTKEFNARCACLTLHRCHGLANEQQLITLCRKPKFVSARRSREYYFCSFASGNLPHTHTHTKRKTRIISKIFSGRSSTRAVPFLKAPLTDLRAPRSPFNC